MTDNTNTRIQAWLEADPDPSTRAELTTLLRDDPSEAQRRFAGRLAFGTAGLRGALGAGPNRMNRVVVRMAAWSLGKCLLATARSGLVVIGYDARPGSREFATDTARVITALGLEAEVADGYIPTPVLAFAVLDRDAVAGVMVTASHNPPGDNGYKVYWGDGAQIVPPIDAEIEALIASRGPLSEAELADLDPEIFVSADTVIGRYLDSIIGSETPSVAHQPPLTVYTPIHGVGGETLTLAYARRGLDQPVMVAEQFEPDGQFPTVKLPNPEEPGALDLAMQTADRCGADLILANDPDADRLGAAVRSSGGWRQLSGDEIGTLLGDHLLNRGVGANRVVACSVVSSTALDRVATHHGVQMRRTLTGFKWIIRAAIDEPQLDYVFGYEEALGFAASKHVRDKDGISAAVAMSELAAELAADGRNLLDRLDEIARRDGLVLTRPVSIRYDNDSNAVSELMDRLRSNPPEVLGDLAVKSVHDWLTDQHPADIIDIDLGSSGRVLIRPSGTEPKIKAYIESTIDIVEDVAAARVELGSRLDVLAAAIADLLTLR